MEIKLRLSLKKLVKGKEHCFFKSLEVGELFTYSNRYLWRDVERIAEKDSITLIYNEPNTREYKSFSYNTGKVKEKK